MKDIHALSVEERRQIVELQDQLQRLGSGEFHADDSDKVRRLLLSAADTPAMQRDVFGLHPLVKDLQTAYIVATEIGMTRGAVLGILLNGLVISGQLTVEQVRKDFGEDVALIVHGLARISELYEKNPIVESENFRQLLLSFAEDMRVILIVIASRVCIMRQIKDAEDDEARRRVATEAAYLYAPLAHKLGLYKLKSELEVLVNLRG